MVSCSKCLSPISGFEPFKKMSCEFQVYLYAYPPTPLPGLRGRRKGSTKHRFGVPVTAPHHWPACAYFWRALASLCMFMVCLRRASHSGCAMLFYSRFEGALSAACVGVANAALFGFPELRFRWCLAFSDPLPTSFLFASVADELHHSGCAMLRARHA